MKPPITVVEVELTQEAATQLLERFLRQRGWEKSCEHPGGLWLWRKHPGGLWLWRKGEYKGVSTEIAWHFERVSG